MKKLNKLQINSEKLMKNEELITLRGGYGTCYYCYSNGGYVGKFYGCCFTESEAVIICNTFYSNVDSAHENYCY
jgi:hypothetical protein